MEEKFKPSYDTTYAPLVTWSTDRVYTIKNFLNDQDFFRLEKSLNNYNDILESGVVGKDGVPHEYVENREVRETDISFLSYDDNSLFWFFDRIIDCVRQVNNTNYGYNLSGIECMQYGVYKGSKKGKYDWHEDCLALPRTSLNQTRKLSFSLLLDDVTTFEGGDLEVRTHKEELRINYNKGDLVFFPSFLHHRVTPITNGIRRSIVGWAYGPDWV